MIRQHTAVVRPRSVPEITLQLVTPALPWWRLTPEELTARHGFVDPYWAFCWPGGSALARLILDQPGLVRGKRVCDLGAGSGVVGIAAALAGAAAVTLNDIDPWALQAGALNAQGNGQSVTLDGRDLIGTPLPGTDVLLLGDVSYARELVARLWPWLVGLAESGMTVLVADPGRGFLPAAAVPAYELRVCSDTEEAPASAAWVKVGVVRL